MPPPSPLPPPRDRRPSLASLLSTGTVPRRRGVASVFWLAYQLAAGGVRPERAAVSPARGSFRRLTPCQVPAAGRAAAEWPSAAAPAAGLCRRGRRPQPAARRSSAPASVAASIPPPVPSPTGQTASRAAQHASCLAMIPSRMLSRRAARLCARLCAAVETSLQPHSTTLSDRRRGRSCSPCPSHQNCNESSTRSVW